MTDEDHNSLADQVRRFVARDGWKWRRYVYLDAPIYDDLEIPGARNRLNSAVKVTFEYINLEDIVSD